MKIIYIKLFLRVSIAAGFISAVADRLGFWPKEKAAWGTWDSFLEYTELLNPWAPEFMINSLGIAATLLEILLAVFLLLGFKTSLSAQASGILLLIFGIAMVTVLGIKAPLDYSVFATSAAAFGLSLIGEQYLEIDQLLSKSDAT
ncbi:DoxX family protein [uncultured Aquimarina sp.]|uniref:DoxX family protein n=1 Tax=uncultured Aquimarina sp. TaxID=575652 RepID=UPI0026180072|nr:DoxX family protein [uncultured Aquimarina sp.]